MRYMLIKFTHTIIKKEKKTCTTGHLLVIITLSDIHNIILNFDKYRRSSGICIVVIVFVNGVLI